MAGSSRIRDRLQTWLLAGYLVVWAGLAWAPVDRQTWALENLVVLATALVLLGIRRRFRFSNFSMTLIVVFLLLHAVGSHYTYSAVPLGFWLQDALGLSRNHYDRFVHLVFGVLWAYPLRELTLRVAHVHGVWSYVIPVVALLALSSGYEIIESWASRIADPEIGMAFVGAQGDIWDGQKDMSLALGGAIFAMLCTAWVHRVTGHEPYVRWLAAGRRSSGHAAGSSAG